MQKKSKTKKENHHGKKIIENYKEDKTRGDTLDRNPSLEWSDSGSRKPLPFMQRELADTAAAMTSPDYKERFRAEYIQTKIRYERLKAFNNKIEAAHRKADARRCRCVNPIEAGSEIDTMMPKHDCPDDLLREQQSVMGQYLHILEVRAVIENIDLGE